MMSATLEQVFKDVSYLSIREKALVAHCLIASLDTEQEDDIDSAWADLAEKRFFELISGKVKAVSWDEINQMTTIAEHKLHIVHQLEELSEESLIEVEKLIARLLKVKQKDNDISDLGGFFKNNTIILSDEELCKAVDFNEELT